MNSVIAANINGTLVKETVKDKEDSVIDKITNGSQSCLLIEDFEYKMLKVVKTSSNSSHLSSGVFNAVNDNSVFNGQKKPKACTDQNKNTFCNSFVIQNGYKEKVEDSMPLPKIQLYSGRIFVEWKHMYKIGAGLNNLGNTCFMNTVVQCLTYCPPLANYLLHDNDHSTKCSIGSNSFCMMCIMQRHMKKTIGKTGEIVKPMDVYQRLKVIVKHFQYGRQEDAHEFLRYVIDNLWKACLSQNNNCSKLDPASKETTVINQIFGGYHRSQVTCMRCKEKSNTYDHFMDFILDIKQNVSTLERALEKFTQPELLEQDNSYKCPKCKMKVTAQKRFTVHRAPNVATFQLKRFDYIRSFGGKITKQIVYPEKLNLRPYMSDTKGEPVLYRLNAVLVHSGPSCNSGHYYCYVKNSNGCWYIMDDQRVSQVSVSNVLNQCAYVLFYVKTEASQAPSIKKCPENNGSVLKGNTSGCGYKKSPDVSLKPSVVVVERNQPKHSSPTLKHPLYSPVNSKKPALSPNINRERVSFGIRSSLPNIQDSSNSSPAKKIKSESPLSNNHAGLVPYMKDSSESSDENEANSRVSVSKTESTTGSTTTLPDDIKKESFKPVIKLNRKHSETPPKIVVKRKLSKSILGFKNSASLNLTPSLPKVIATGSWTVTEDPISSSPVASNCSSTSVNSDWQVTDEATEAVTNATTTSNSSPVSKENGWTSPQPEKVQLVSSNEIYSSKLDIKNASDKTYASPSSPQNSVPPCSNSVESSNVCDFRKENGEERPFLDRDANSLEQHSLFLKRKHEEFDQKVSETPSDSYLSESRPASVPKKAKYSEDPLESPCKNGVKSFKVKEAHPKRTVDDRESRLDSPWKKTVNSHCDKPLNRHEISRNKNRVRDGVSSRSSSRSSEDYEWVEKTIDDFEEKSIDCIEKTKDIIESKPKSPYKDKREKRNYHPESSSYSKLDRKHDVVSELKKNSGYFYGSSVPTWNGEHHYKDSSRNNNGRQDYFDGYEDEYDRGKIRKSKPKDRYQNSYRENPFQHYGERNYDNRYKYNKNYGHQKDHYDNRPRWKQHQNGDYPRNRRFFKSNFRR